MTDPTTAISAPLTAPLTATASRLVADIEAGLWGSPPSLPPRWFYDERGSRLFDEITRLPEYYPTRRETEILTDRAPEIADLTDATTLVELGSGMSTKTRLLLDALTEGGRSMSFVPVDVSVEVLADSARRLADEYRTLEVSPLAADFTEPFADLPGRAGERLVAFLGGTIGNLDDGERVAFLRRLHEAMSPGDSFLLGADLVKDPSRLVAAYDDSAGVTADFNRNLIEVLRAELDVRGLQVEDFAHVARWNARCSRIEMWLRAVRPVTAYFSAIDRTWIVPAGGELLTEISVKFERRHLEDELAACGFETTRAWSDRAQDFLMLLAARR